MSKRKYQCAPDLIAYPENAAVTYRGLQLIMKQVSFACGPVTPMVQALFGQLLISAGYMIIAEWNSLDTFTLTAIAGAVVTIIVSWAAFLTLAGKMHKSSDENYAENSRKVRARSSPRSIQDCAGIAETSKIKTMKTCRIMYDKYA